MSLKNVSKDPLSPSDLDTFVEQCRDLAEEATFAQETLLGIATTVESTGVITDRQREAVENIEHGYRRRQAEEREFRPKYSRRYEGWSR